MTKSIMSIVIRISISKVIRNKNENRQLSILFTSP
jgi:hypothetical protein